MYPPSEVFPPPSLSRPRPWSPDPTDPLPPLRSFAVRTSPGRTSATHPYPGHDASEPSIDALDFADYARTLNRYPYPNDPAYDDYLLPPPPRSVSVASHASLHPPSLVSSRGTPTSQSHNTSGGVPNSEIDVSQFPAWSRGWYAKDSRISKTGPQSEVSHAPFFDPSYRATGLAGNYDPYAATNSTSTRDFVPWSNTDTPNYDLPLDPELKEERIRMLEHEFRSGAVAPIEEPVGSVDEKGRLVTDGPKKRVAVRVIETMLALGIAVSVVYAALWIKTPKPPPPQSKPHTFALYALSVLTSLFLLYRFLFRPCCCGRRRKKRTPAGFGPSGLAVLPVQGLPGEKAKKKTKGKKGKQERGDVQVNLIVDPTMFGSLRPDEENANLDELLSSSFSQSGASGRPKRRSIFEGLAIEEEWRAARKELKQTLFLDTVCFFLWFVEFIWILIRERCPPGSFNGWCNAYNVASAGACLLGLVFGVNVFFDVKDLHQSRESPRIRS
ncbi:hypothetical protein BGY98DRAFT_1089806 [Russula aff. rugulosa BPL654]|nr:hypothetical protein BGY98DRAFT_1089806 [Russula aff. rugulosa BPL654]